jgi:3-deoxy-D-manno-octulosonate 8-phosphate phosphatase (KDO 8-P phosphatase)
MSNYKSLLKNITTFIFDYDGVLTDGTVILQADGEALRTRCSRLRSRPA